MGLTLNDYQSGCLKTAAPIHDTNEALLFGAVCISGEAGELANYVKKICWHGHDFDKFKIADELGDILWYIARLASDLNFSLEAIAEFNLEKLSRRYPDGFSKEASRNRKD